MGEVTIAAPALASLRCHGERDYPNEACGLLLGTSGAAGVAIDESFPVRNLNEERARDRYDLDPRGQLEADRRARGSGRDVVGVYHSHPDHPALPSEFDRAHAYPGWVYVIVKVAGGVAAEAGAFVLGETDEAFAEVALRTT